MAYISHPGDFALQNIPRCTYRPLSAEFARQDKMTIQFPIMSFDYFQPSPAKQFVTLTKNPRTSSGQINSLFHQLKPIQLDDLIGEWDGYILATGHPFEDELENLNWFGNTFDATDDVAPLIVARNGERVCYEDWGRASVSCSLLFLGLD